jgi:hypothetical protein
MRLASVALALLVVIVLFGCGGSKQKQTGAATSTAATPQTTPTGTAPTAPAPSSPAAHLAAIQKCLKAAGYDVDGQNSSLTDQALFVDIEAVSIFLFGSPAEAHRKLPAVVDEVADPKAKIKVVGDAVVSYSGLRLATEPDYISKNGAKIEGCVTRA